MARYILLVIPFALPVFSRDPEAVVETQVEASSGGTGKDICGNPLITKLLNEESGVRNIQWATIVQLVHDQEEVQGRLVKTLRREYNELQTLLPFQRAAEQPGRLTDDEIDTLVRASLTSPASFGSVKRATESDCGVEEGREVEYDAAKNIFQSHAGAKVSGLARVDGVMRVYQRCIKLLNVVEEVNKFKGCEELCMSFARTAASLSEAHIPRILISDSYDKLVSEANHKNFQLKEAEGALASCEAEKMSLAKLREQHTKLLGNIVDQSRNFRNLSASLAQESNAYRVFLEAYTADKQQVQEAYRVLTVKRNEGHETDELADLLMKQYDEELKTVLEAMGKQQALVESTTRMVREAQTTLGAVNGFREKLASLLLAAEQYYSDAIREPLGSVGIEANASFRERFPHVNTTEQAAVVKKNFQAISEFCSSKDVKEDLEGVPKVAITEANRSIGLAAICDQAWGDVSSMMIDRIASAQAGAISSLEEIQKESLPYNEWVNVAEIGEAFSKSYFGQTLFALNYLSGWRHDGRWGSMLTLYQKMGETFQELTQKRELAQTGFGALSKQLLDIRSSIEKRAMHVEKLHNAAFDKQAAAMKRLSDAGQLVAKDQRRQLVFDAARQEMKMKVEAAHKSFADAKIQLERLHAASFLDARTQVEELGSL